MPERRSGRVTGGGEWVRVMLGGGSGFVGGPDSVQDRATDGGEQERLLAKPNYQFEKRRKELEKKRKKEEKRQRKAERTGDTPDEEHGHSAEAEESR